MPETPEVKIEEKLTELLAVSPRTNTEIANEIGVSTSSLTQYRQGTARPSLHNLVALSQVFDVSLDYLVFGEEHADEELNVDPIVRYMDQSLQDMQVRTAEHTSLVVRVGKHISEKLDEEVNEYLSESAHHHHSGTISDTETLSLERNSKKTKLVLRNFGYNLIDAPCETPGRFFMTVANNLNQGREYQYLLPKDADTDWSTTVQDFKRLLEKQTSNKVVARTNCQFRVTDAPIVVGFGLYQVDVDAFREDNKMLHDFLMDQNYIDGLGRFGYISPPSISGRVDSIMDDEYLSTACDLFDGLWKEAEPI